jgi:hypothetical protein
MPPRRIIRVLIICANNQSVEAPLKNKADSIIEEYLNPHPDDIVEYHYNNENREELNREDIPRKCIANLFTSSEGDVGIHQRIRRCFGLPPEIRGILFDAIYLEQCPQIINTSEAFQNFSHILNENGRLIINSFEKIFDQGMETLWQMRRYLTNPDLTSDEIVADLEPEYAGHLEEELGFYKQSRGLGREATLSRDDLFDFMLFWVLENDFIDPKHLTIIDGQFIFTRDQLNDKILRFNLIVERIDTDNIVMLRVQTEE